MDQIQELAVKYGAFKILDGVGWWSADNEVRVYLKKSDSDANSYEGFWNPCPHELKTEYRTAVSGLCLWNKYDCVFYLKPNGKGNPGAERSPGNPRDRVDLLKRLTKGQRVERIVVSKDPFGPYQQKMIDWQADVVRRYHIQNLFYSLPVDEYISTFQEFEQFLSPHCIEEMHQILHRYNALLEEKVSDTIRACIEFIHPMRQDRSLTPEQSYAWPYQHLRIDLGIEEMEDVRIPYEVMKSGVTVPPILLGMLGLPNPYYQRRNHQSESEYVCLML